MSVTCDPRFICRREGCEPSAFFKITSGAQFVQSVVVPCKRCGKPIEVQVGHGIAAEVAT